MLDPAYSNEERDQMFAMLQRNVQQATHMLTELLDYSRLEADQEELQLGLVDVAELLNGLVDRARPLLEGRKLWIT